MSDTTVECHHCKGKRYFVDYQYSRQRLLREVKRKCCVCKGTGRVEPRDDRPLYQREAEEREASGESRPDIDEAIRLIYGER